MSNIKMQTRKEENYRKILDTSWDIAIKDGLESLSVRKVAAALGFAPNNLYNYFKNKNELLYQLKKDAYEWTISVVLGDRPNNVTVKELFETISYRLLDIAIKEPERYFVMTSDLIIDSEEPLDQQIHNFVVDQIKRGIEYGEFKMVDPEMSATNIRTTLISFLRWVSSHKNLTRDQANSYLDNLLSIIFNGISTETNGVKETK